MSVREPLNEALAAVSRNLSVNGASATVEETPPLNTVT